MSIGILILKASLLIIIKILFMSRKICIRNRRSR